MTMTPKLARELVGHTPGPWTWRDDINFNTWSLHPGVYEVARGESEGTPGGDEIDQANARLIAAAPDLLAAYLAATDEIERLRGAGIAALRFIKNTENEMGIILGCGNSLRQALKQKEPKP